MSVLGLWKRLEPGVDCHSHSPSSHLSGVSSLDGKHYFTLDGLKEENSLSKEESMLLFDIVMGKHFSLKAMEKFTEVRDDGFCISEQKLLWVINNLN